MGRQERLRKSKGKIRLRYQGPRNWQRFEERSTLDLLGEVRHIQRLAAAFDARVIVQGELAFFSTDTGVAWMLDTADHFAMRLAQGGDPLPVPIEDTDTRYVVGWPGSYRIDGALFLYLEKTEESIREVAIMGYPVDQIGRNIGLVRNQESSLDGARSDSDDDLHDSQ
jgi:hypothetical protein